MESNIEEKGNHYSTFPIQKNLSNNLYDLYIKIFDKETNPGYLFWDAGFFSPQEFGYGYSGYNSKTIGYWLFFSTMDFLFGMSTHNQMKLSITGLNVESDDPRISFDYQGEIGFQGAPEVQKGLDNFVKYICDSSPYRIEANDPVIATHVKFISEKDPNTWFIWDLSF